MGKYIIEYKRTVRVRQYETLTIGYSEEFDSTSDVRSNAYEWVNNLVNDWIDEELRRFGSKEGK